jgi:hypothetical protein
MTPLKTIRTMLVSDNLEGVLDFLKLQDKHNIHMLCNILFICILCSRCGTIYMYMYALNAQCFIYVYVHSKCAKYLCLFVCLMVFNPSFNNISVISWRSVLLVEETWKTRRKPPNYHKSLTNFIT